MATTTTTSLNTSNLRTSSRQTRTNPTRTSRTVGSSLRQNSLISNPATAVVNEPHGFYPAITHFTDAITALPREYRRHTSLLKEVDAKAWAPEENLQTLLKACIAAQPAHETFTAPQPTDDASSSIADAQTQRSAANSVISLPIENASQVSATSLDPATLKHRRLFYDLRVTLTEMMVTMDEKNHVVNNANEDLSRHMRRIEAIFPHIASEVSEEARLGSMTHWAYTDRVPAKAPGHSSRREAAASLATMHETDIATRSESRREAVAARKQRQTHVDSDFDDQRHASKRATTNGKNRRVGEIAAEEKGLGIFNAGPAPRRKKPEKPAVPTPEAVVSKSNAGGVTMSRENSQQDGATKKRKAATSGINPVARKKYVYSHKGVAPTDDLFLKAHNKRFSRKLSGPAVISHSWYVWQRHTSSQPSASRCPTTVVQSASELDAK